ncbi:hypothetical protein B0H16DRAFT_1540640 [Mycena metata]|uniref:C2H2-type domain-containing protein n=1 Tax=Mycena metata TaxID=1033252 RepID=A0AAD7NDR3_9AGAR|nr:hypothetical protein B0H16DRAFT_1540640 [Mycena metata]
MTEDYTPSIYVEGPAPDSDDQALLASLGAFDNSYAFGNDMIFGTADQCYSSTPALFIQPCDSANPSELSPLENFSAGFHDYRYSPSTSGRNSPIDPWSPASSSSEVYPDDSEDFWSHQYLSGHSSPALSPSLSPLANALDGLKFDERYPGLEQTVLPSGLPTMSRLRSSSHSVQSVSPAEVWTDGIGRGRSASFTALTNNNQFYHNTSSAQQGDNANIEIAVVDANVPLGTGMSWGNASVGQWDNERVSDDALAAPHSPSLLTVPSLRRRPACSAASRRSRSHSDLGFMMSPDQDSGRGRGLHRSALSVPNSRSISNGSGSRAPSPHGALFSNDVRTAASYSPSSPSSPAFEDAEFNDAGISLGRRHTVAASRGSAKLLSPVLTLSRASSTPTRGRRPKASPSLRKPADLYTFEGVKVEASPSPFISAQASDCSFHVSPSVSSFKHEVASNKIRQASSARRLNAAPFKCPLETCGSTFTARHNLTNHINSHNKHRPHRCLCGLSFTTQGVLARHKKRCSK